VNPDLLRELARVFRAEADEIYSAFIDDQSLNASLDRREIHRLCSIAKKCEARADEIEGGIAK
jgi:hypothetical protein